MKMDEHLRAENLRLLRERSRALTFLAALAKRSGGELRVSREEVEALRPDGHFVEEERDGALVMSYREPSAELGIP